MASPKSEHQADVYIPMCDRNQCMTRLLDLSRALEAKNIICVTENKISGSFARWFKASFEDCPFTIIHRCKNLWEKISQFEQQLRNDDNDIRIMTIDMSTKAKRRHSFETEDSFSNFFAQYSVSIVNDGTSMSSFVAKVVQLLAESGVGLRHLPDLIDSQFQEKHNGFMKGSDDDDESAEVNFVSYPDMFGHKSVQVRESLVKCSEKEAAKFSGLKLHEWAEWKDDLMAGKSLPRSEFLVHKALQELFEGKKIIELACIASCSDIVLQEEAFILLQHLLLSANEDGSRLNLNTQIQLESLLLAGLGDLFERYQDKQEEDKSAAVPIQRLTVLYMIVLSDMVMSCSNREQINLCHMHLISLKDRVSVLDKVHELQVFVQDVSRKECSILKKTVRKYVEAKSPEIGKKLCKENTAVQACVIVHIMKQMFKSLNAANLDLLFNFVDSQNNKAAENNNQPTACMTLLIGCLTVFISFGLKKMKHQDLESTHEKALKIINLYLTRSLTEDMYRYVQILLFDCHPIQKEIFNKSCNVEGSSKKSYDKDQSPFLLNQLGRLLSPLLVPGDILKGGSYSESKFVLVSGKLGNQDVFIRVHYPNVTSHRERNEIGSNTWDDVSYNEMEKLQKLQHRNIIKLFAFHKNRIPQFYIVEDHVKNNLQTTLKFKRNNKDLFKQASLIKFLIDTAAALEYCHSKLHVHCNLTAESLFIVNDSSIKLCGFHLCLELVHGRGKIDGKKIPLVPIRWTAPESLKDKEYTTESDIWMFGHLIYEVLSHGQLPYPLSEDVEDLSKKIIEGVIPLPEEPCFRREHYQLISQCAENIPEYRPRLSDISKQLDRFYIESSESERQHAAVFSYDSNHKPSTDNEKGIPDIFQSDFLGGQILCDRVEVVAISDTIQRLKLTDKYIFLEKIVHGKTQNLAAIVENGKLSNILLGVKICQNYGEALHIECHVPSSCQDSLLYMAFSRTLGSSLKPYLDCLLEVALVLEELHNISWALGDVCASNLYVEQQDQNFKVYVVSLAYMLPQELEVIPDDPRVYARAAPEVIKGGIFSPESDVYCFGNLIWEVFIAFDQNSFENFEKFMISMERSHSTPSEEYKKKSTEMWEASHKRPKCCPDSLFGLITACVHSSSVKRIKLSQVIEQLQRIRSDLNDEQGNEDSVEASA